MIQTAEGALNETQDILQRMRELAVQSGNDTNTESDREQIQKEMNQLTSEINRIGNTTEFNTQKLLDGGDTAFTAGAKVSGSTLSGGTDAKAGSWTLDISAVAEATDTFEWGGVTVTFAAGADNDVDASTDTTATVGVGDGTTAGTAASLAAAFNAAAANSDSPLNGFTFDSDGNNLLITGTAVSGETLNSETPTIVQNGGTSALAASAVNTVAGQDATGATGTLSFNSVPTAGTTVNVGDMKILFTDAKGLAEYNADPANGNPGIAAAGGNDATNKTYVVNIDDDSSDTVAEITSKLANDTALNSTALGAGDYNVAITSSADGNTLTFTADVNDTQSTAGGSGNNLAMSINNTNASGSFEATLQIGANKDQMFKVDIADMRAGALGLTGTTSDYTSGFTVTNGSSSTQDEKALDVSTYEKANKAIEVIDNAIQSVSNERSKLGAFQNRLDHTINNLGTSSENLTAAESRIRDVDYALAA